VQIFNKFGAFILAAALSWSDYGLRAALAIQDAIGRGAKFFHELGGDGHFSGDAIVRVSISFWPLLLRQLAQCVSESHEALSVGAGEVGERVLPHVPVVGREGHDLGGRGSWGRFFLIFAHFDLQGLIILLTVN